MLEIKFIRENPELISNAIQQKNEKACLDTILQLDESKRKLQFEYDNLRAEQNRCSKEIPILKKTGQNEKPLLAKLGNLAEQLKDISSNLNTITKKLDDELLKVPNIPLDIVPVGGESENQIIRYSGEKKEFSFTPRDHIELAELNELLDFKRSGKISGSGFAIYTGQGALLERALINFMLDYHIARHGYEEISLPILVNRKAMTGTGQLPKLEDDMYLVEQDDFFLVPTAEVSVTNYFMDEILNNGDLPRKFVSYSPCFRREAGSYGKDTRGLQRLHQFNKVEMVRLVHPDQSFIALEQMINDAEDILQALGLHYRVVRLATGDLSFASAITYDLEVWAPGIGKYLEISSISNFVDFQSRRANIRFRDSDDKVKYVHTLNGSGLATPRTFIALIETYQRSDGSYDIPDVLKRYIDATKYQKL
ncbi:MAG: serine--tRNA ligase [Candidatus Cloacimonetes bacterium]|nr:serine--tRNA ligase [Candidatus Cloacimonadota bacterium]